MLFKGAIFKAELNIENMKTLYEETTNFQLSYSRTRSFAVAKVDSKKIVPKMTININFHALKEGIKSTPKSLSK